MHLLRLCQEEIKSEVFQLKYKGRVLNQKILETITEEHLGKTKATSGKIQNEGLQEFGSLAVDSIKRGSPNQHKMTDVFVESRNKMLHLSSLMKRSSSQVRETRSENQKKNNLSKQRMPYLPKSVNRESLGMMNESELKQKSTHSTQKLKQDESKSNISHSEKNYSHSQQEFNPAVLNKSDQAKLISNVKFCSKKWTDLLESLIEQQNYLLQPTVLEGIYLNLSIDHVERKVPKYE